MKERYRLYRSYGHPRWVAFVLAPKPEHYFGALMFAVGLQLGALIWDITR